MSEQEAAASAEEAPQAQPAGEVHGEPGAAPVAPREALQVANRWLAMMLRRGWQLSLLLALVVLAFRVVNLFQIQTLWDDTYIFQRYCDNLLRGDGWAWHRGGEPTYGTTSLLYVLPATLLRALTGSAGLSALLAGVIGGVAFVVVMALSLRRAPGYRAVRAAALLLALLWCAKSAVANHFTSGMDTTWVLAFLAGWFWLLVRLRTQPGRRRAVALGVMGGLAFAMRPDLLVFCLGIPAAWWLLVVRDRSARRPVAIALGLTAGLTALQLLFNTWYFKTPLPLPFYAKTLGIYGGSLQRVYRAVSSDYLVHFAGETWPLLVLLGLDLLASPQRWWRQAHPGDKATLATSLVFAGYYWLVALPVMGFQQRFYHPLIVPLVWMALHALERWRAGLGLPPPPDPVPKGGAQADPARPPIDPSLALGLHLAGAVGLALAMFLLWPEVPRHGPAFARAVLRRDRVFDVHKYAASKGPREYWYKLNEVMALPDDMVIAATEVGMLAAVSGDKRIIDMAGLNEPAFALQPFDAERLLRDHKPDLIYMPHRDYDVMRKALIESPGWAGYDYFDYRRLRTKSFGVAIRRDSRHYPQMSKLLPAGRRKRATPVFEGSGRRPPRRR